MTLGPVTQMGENFTMTYTFAPSRLGTKLQDINGTYFILVQAAVAAAQGDLLYIDNTFKIQAAVTTTTVGAAPQKLGVYQTASGLLINNYGWVAVSGPMVVNVSAATAANVKVYTTATAGKVSGTATVLVGGLYLTAATAGAQTAASAFATQDLCVNTFS